MNTPCCRLDEEFICGVVRNRSGIDSGELDYTIRVVRAEKDLPNVIKEVERLLAALRARAGVTGPEPIAPNVDDLRRPKEVSEEAWNVMSEDERAASAWVYGMTPYARSETSLVYAFRVGAYWQREKDARHVVAQPMLNPAHAELLAREIRGQK